MFNKVTLLRESAKLCLIKMMVEDKKILKLALLQCGIV